MIVRFNLAESLEEEIFFLLKKEELYFRQNDYRIAVE